MLLQPSTGFGSVADVRLGDHLCLPVDSDEERLAGTAEFVAHGLGRGGKVMVLTYTESPDEMAAALVERVVGACDALAAGQLLLSVSVDVLFRSGEFDPQRTRALLRAQTERAHEQGYAGLWVAADLAWSRSGLPGSEALLDYETVANLAFLDRQIAAVCIYDLRIFPMRIMEQFCSAHPVTLGQATLRFARTTDGLMLSGEADFTNRRALTALLAHLQATEGHVTIDTSELCFADLHAVRLLSEVIRTRGRGSTTLTASPRVHRVMALAAGSGRWSDA